MTQQVSCNLFAGSLLQQVRSVIMPQRVQMILFRKAILGIQLAQMSGECVRVWHMTVQIGEDGLAVVRLAAANRLPMPQAHQKFPHLRRNYDNALPMIFCVTFYNSLPGHITAGVADCELIRPGNVLPAQGAQLTAPQPGGNRHCVIGFVQNRLVHNNFQQSLHFVLLRSESNRIIIKETDGNKREYILTKFSRSNQSNCYNQRPIVFKGDKVKAGDVIADGPSTSQGELALGKNPLIGFMTWEGYNYEDAVLLSERLVEYDVYTSVHIEEYEVESRDTKLGPEEITRDVPGVGDDALKDLDERGIIRVGAEVRAGDILVGKVTPKGETELTAEERLLRAIFGEKAREVRDTSLKVPHGAYGIIVDAKVFTRENGDELSPGVNQSVRIYIAQKRKISVGDKMAGRHGNKGVVSRVLPVEDMPFLPNGRPLDIVLNPLGVPSRMNIGQVLEIHLSLAAKALGFNISTPVFDGANEVDIEDTLELANDYVNLPFDKEELEKDLQAEHPYWSADAEIFYDKYVDTLREDVMEYLSTNRAHRSLWKGVPISKDGKVQLRDGRTGECFDGKTTIGHMHYLKLHHLVDDKIHARSTGPYSLVTQQPLGGKAQFGGQRFGEMEVWALEAYGAAYTLQEILTMKSDDVVGRVKTYEAIIKGENIPEPGIPESFKVLLKELQALGLDVKVLDENREEVELIETSEYGNTDINSIIGNDKDYAFEDSESFAEHGFSKKEFDDNEELVDIEEEESPETADDDIFADEVLDDEE